VTTDAGARFGSRSRMNGIRKFPQTFTSVQTAITAMPGRTSGTTTSLRIWKGEAPNTRADSS
jgi:hypothetical protein